MKPSRKKNNSSKIIVDEYDNLMKQKSINLQNARNYEDPYNKKFSKYGDSMDYFESFPNDGE